MRSWIDDNSGWLMGIGVSAVLALIGMFTYMYYFPAHASWRNVCIKSHTETYYTPVTTCSGTGSTQSCTTNLQTQYNEICDQHEWQCFKGRDGSTVCEPR